MRRHLTTTAALATALLLGAPAAIAAADTSDAAIDRAPTDRVEALDLGCRVRPARPAVACRWSVPTTPTVVRVRLLRLDPTVDEHRRVIFRTGEPEVHQYVDRKVRRGHTYAYAVQGLDARGHVVARSRTVRVTVPALERLRLDCELGRTAEAIGCHWAAPTFRQAAVVQLWRSVDGAQRELVVRRRPSGPTSYREPVPAGASEVTYVLIARTRTGRVIGRSRPDTVTIPRDAAPRAEELIAP